MHWKSDLSYDRSEIVFASGSAEPDVNYHDVSYHNGATFPTSEQLSAWLDGKRLKQVSLDKSRISGVIDRPKFAVCIPVHDEAEALPATLAALDTALRSSSQAGVVVLLINDTRDGSAGIALAWAQRTGHACVIVEVLLERTIRNAPHARRLALEIGADLCPTGALLTTDADTLVAPDWITANLRHLDRGTALICGAVDVSEGEIDALPATVRLCGEAEAAYFALSERAWARWCNGTGPALATRAMGASLAINAPLYRQLGGLPLPHVAEDKALARLVRRAGHPIVEAQDVRVMTSCRLDARARGGMGDALLERCYIDDPLCDEALVPAAVLVSRSRVWNHLYGHPGAALHFEDMCDLRADLSAPRMRLSDVKRETGHLARMLQSNGHSAPDKEIAA